MKDFNGNQSNTELKSLFSRIEIVLTIDNINSIIEYINKLNQNIQSCDDQNCLNADLKGYINENKK